MKPSDSLLQEPLGLAGPAWLREPGNEFAPLVEPSNSLLLGQGGFA
jgi:hypothetical protein